MQSVAVTATSGYLPQDTAVGTHRHVMHPMHPPHAPRSTSINAEPRPGRLDVYEVAACRERATTRCMLACLHACMFVGLVLVMSPVLVLIVEPETLQQLETDKKRLIWGGETDQAWSLEPASCRPP